MVRKKYCSWMRLDGKSLHIVRINTASVLAMTALLGCQPETPSVLTINDIPIEEVTLQPADDTPALIHRLDSIMIAIYKESSKPPQPILSAQLPSTRTEALSGKHIMQLFQHLRVEDGYHLHCTPGYKNSKSLGLLNVQHYSDSTGPRHIKSLVRFDDSDILEELSLPIAFFFMPHTASNPLHHVIADGSDDGYIELVILAHFRHYHWLLNDVMTDANLLEHLVDSMIQDDSRPYSSFFKENCENSYDCMLPEFSYGENIYMNKEELEASLSYTRMAATPRVVQRTANTIITQHIEYNLRCFDRYFEIVWNEISKDPPYQITMIKSEPVFEFGTNMLCD
jgi:hypothetical protein